MPEAVAQATDPYGAGPYGAAPYAAGNPYQGGHFRYGHGRYTGGSTAFGNPSGYFGRTTAVRDEARLSRWARRAAGAWHHHGHWGH